MKLPSLHGYIDRRILVNFTADADIISKLLPEPFKPKLYQGKAIVGICLIRLKNIKPKGLPNFIGIASENGAHRIAVTWEEDGLTKEGVYIPRRDTSLRLNALAGGTLFPGKHHLAKFHVQEADGHFHIDFTSSDQTSIYLDAREANALPADSIFETIENASRFFEQGAVGYSPNGKKLEGLKLHAYNWQIRPLDVLRVSSSFFADESIFPKGSVRFDHALLMTGIEYEWHSVQDKPLVQECL
jgi:hypothetical protein